MTTTKKIITGIACIVLGGILVGTGFMQPNADYQTAADNWKRLNDGAGVQIEAKVIESESHAQSEGSRRTRKINTVYCPVYEYTVDGSAYRVAAISDDCTDDRGDIVMGATGTVIYDKSNPNTAFVKSDATAAFYDRDEKGVDFFMLSLGTVFIIAGALVLISARPKTPEQLRVAAEKRKRQEEELARAMAELEQESKK